MKHITAEKSQKLLDILISNVQSYHVLLDSIEDEFTKQNILRSIILFSCSGIDAVVKQLILETLDSVIARDVGAQEQLKSFIVRQLKKDSDFNYKLLADLLTKNNIRESLITLLKNSLTFNSLQSPEQLFKVASFFNIKTADLINNDKREILSNAFAARNKIIHQMDVDLEKGTLDPITHTIDEVNGYYQVLVSLSQNFIDEVNQTLKKEITEDYTPIIVVNDGVLSIQDI